MFKVAAISGSGDGNQLCDVDLEAFLVGILQSIPVDGASLPYTLRVTKLQSDFFQAVCNVRSNTVSRADLVNYRNIIRSGKNAIRLKGTEPSVETVAAIGTYFAVLDDHFNAIRYLETIEAKLKHIANNGGVIKSTNPTIFGVPVVNLKPKQATFTIELLTECRGQAAEFKTDTDEAIRLYQLANTASSLYRASKLVYTEAQNADDSQDTLLDLYGR